MKHIRIENDTMMGHDTKVIHVDEHGTETDISSVCRDIKLHLSIDGPNTATMEMIKIQGSFNAALVDATVKTLRPARFSWLGRLREVTTFNRNGQRSYVRS